MTREGLESELAALALLNRPDLIARYRDLYDREPPLRLSRAVMVLAVGYRLQEQAFGEMKPAIRRSLLSGNSVPALPSASTGTVLIREWHGQRHTVTVHPKGVEYRGERFGSLSQVARLITGQTRSGPAFFGLRGTGRGV
jgi:hypothetical protein